MWNLKKMMPINLFAEQNQITVRQKKPVVTKGEKCVGGAYKLSD